MSLFNVWLTTLKRHIFAVTWPIWSKKSSLESSWRPLSATLTNSSSRARTATQLQCAHRLPRQVGLTRQNWTCNTQMASHKASTAPKLPPTPLSFACAGVLLPWRAWCPFTQAHVQPAPPPPPWQASSPSVSGLVATSSCEAGCVRTLSALASVHVLTVAARPAKPSLQGCSEMVIHEH